MKAPLLIATILGVSLMAGCRCFEGRGYIKSICEHCYCIDEDRFGWGGTTASVPHVTCCKCGDRRALSGNYTLSVRQ